MSEKKSVNITVISGDSVRKVTCSTDDYLLSVLRTEGFFVNANCSGKGICGKCKVRCKPGTRISKLDRAHLSDHEIISGVRLACALKPTEGLVVYAQEDDKLASTDDYTENFVRAGDELYLAIDIGTTTIAERLVNTDGSIVGTAVFNNPQRIYGADVVSRQSAATKGKAENMRLLLTLKIKEDTETLLEKAEVSPEKIKKCAIACNTTMGHILMGFDCSTLGVHPFTPVNIDKITKPFNEIFEGSKITADTVLMPGISTYVGGDIVAGIYDTDIINSDSLCLLIDLGTNGEMALGNKDKILTASAAAGPAFEGGNIACGTGSIPGAINSACIAGGRIVCSTVGGEPVRGICGTGVIDVTASLVQTGLLDKAGFFHEDYEELGYPLTRDGKYRFIQDDIRQVQLAKSAVRSGIETLMERYGCTAGDIENIYVAGGFSRNINIKNAATIGIIPKEFTEKAKCIGNSALNGAVKYLLNADGDEFIEKIKAISTEITLADDDLFNDLFIDNITF